MAFPARLVTPEAVLFEEEVEAVILRDGLGDVTFLSGHSPLVGTVEAGLVRFVRTEGDELRVAAHGGFVHVEWEGRVTVLPPAAEVADQIDVERAQRALEAADAKLTELAGTGRASDDEGASSDLEVLEATAAKRRAEVRIEVAAS